ncbi:MAG: hypothetical protein ABFR75_11995 [Acidobacteriota bacterium]
MKLPMALANLSDFIGVLIVLALAFLILKTAISLKLKIKGTNIWYFLFFFTIAQFTFAIARSMGHILQHSLLTFNLKSIWKVLKPFSIEINTITFVVVFTISLLMIKSLKSFLED